MAQEQFIYYFGGDEAYFKVFQGEFNTRYGQLGFKFTRYFETEPSKIQSLYSIASKGQPKLILIDYSKHSADYLHLARLLIRTHGPTEFKVIGLLDYLSSPDVIRESVLTGVKINHIKSAEIFDAVFAAMKLINDKNAATHTFAVAASDGLTIEAGIPCKINSLGLEKIQFETNLSLTVGETIDLKNFWTQEKIIKSDKIVIEKVDTSQLVYNFNYAVEGKLTVVDPPHFSEEMNEERKSELAQNYTSDLIKFRKKLKTWLSDNTTRSQKKDIKLLVLDDELMMLNNQKPTDQYDFIIRCQPTSIELEIEINKLRPHIIVLVLTETQILANLVQVIKSKYAESSPFIIVFNAETLESKDLQDKLSYEHVLAYPSELTPEVLLKMAGVFSKKFVKPPEADKVFLGKKRIETLAEISTQMKVINCSEVDMVFESHLNLPMHSVVHFYSPVDMYVTIMPNEKVKGPAYYGLINGIGETGKNDLRRFVNSIFFRDLETQKGAEKEEFEKLKADKIKEMEELAALEAAKALEIQPKE